MKYVVMFSGGIGSWATARRLVNEHGTENVTCLFSDVKGDTDDPHIGEDEDTYRFIDDSIAQLGCKYVRVSRRVRRQRNQRDIGIDWTEMHRLPAIEKAYAPWQVVFPMCEKPYLSKDQMIDWARDCGIDPPRLYSLGFAHNNCGGGCVRAGQGQFKKLLEIMPERYNVWAEKEQEIRDYLGKDVTILKEQKNNVRKNLSLIELRDKSIDSCDMLDLGGCGCFVEDFSMSDDKEQS